MATDGRVSTGLADLDEVLGGGLIPGTLTVVVGATGIGKTQLGLQYAWAGKATDGEPGLIFDMTSRGDSQNQPGYAQRMFDWPLRTFDIERAYAPATAWDAASRTDYCHIFARSGRRVMRGELDTDEWQDWKAELNRKLEQAIYFFYSGLSQGVRRCVIDGVEPTERPSESFQFHVFQYVYHQILRKDADWVARDLFRIQFRSHQAEIERRMYDVKQLTCLLLYTSHETMLDDLIARPLASGDDLANANTIILMGKTRQGNAMGRALYVSKHRGSAVRDEIVPFTIGDGGLRLM